MVTSECGGAAPVPRQGREGAAGPGPGGQQAGSLAGRAGLCGHLIHGPAGHWAARQTCWNGKPVRGQPRRPGPAPAVIVLSWMAGPAASLHGPWGPGLLCFLCEVTHEQAVICRCTFHGNLAM